MAEEKTFAASLGIEAHTAEELGCKLSGDYEAIPEDKKEVFLALEENIKNSVAARVAANVEKAKAEAPAPEAGVTISGYEYVDIVALSPTKPFIFPPWVNLPHKIVAGNETIWHRAVLLINPLPGPGGTPTGLHNLGSRDLRVTFSITNVTNPTAPVNTGVWNGEFVGLAPAVTTFYWPVFHPDPGPNPHIYELNVTFDVLDPEQPYAAFATRWYDLDTDPGWPWPIAVQPPWMPPGTLPPVPPIFPRYRVQTPLRYLVYTE